MPRPFFPVTLASAAVAAGFLAQAEPAEASPDNGSNITHVYNGGRVNPDGPEFRMRVSSIAGRPREVDVDVCYLTPGTRGDGSPGLAPMAGFFAAFNVETQQLLAATTAEQRAEALRAVAQRARSEGVDAVMAEYPHVFEVGILRTMSNAQVITYVAAIGSRDTDPEVLGDIFNHVQVAHGVEQAEILEAIEMARLYFDSRDETSRLRGVDFTDRGGQPIPQAEAVCPR